MQIRNYHFFILKLILLYMLSQKITSKSSKQDSGLNYKNGTLCVLTFLSN